MIDRQNLPLLGAACRLKNAVKAQPGSTRLVFGFQLSAFPLSAFNFDVKEQAFACGRGAEDKPTMTRLDGNALIGIQLKNQNMRRHSTLKGALRDGGLPSQSERLSNLCLKKRVKGADFSCESENCH